jgi:hypothetical protein
MTERAEHARSYCTKCSGSGYLTECHLVVTVPRASGPPLEFCRKVESEMQGEILGKDLLGPAWEVRSGVRPCPCRRIVEPETRHRGDPGGPKGKSRRHAPPGMGVDLKSLAAGDR